ncbi:hypothetical protein ACKWTF_013345 [Chironomus riparius]
MICSVCKTSKNIAWCKTACDHLLHRECFDNLKKVSRTKVCATCKRPVLKGHLRTTTENTTTNIITEKNKIIDQLRQQVNYVTSNNNNLTTHLRDYRQLIESISEISQSTIDNRLIQRLTEQLSFVTKLHTQKTIAFEMLAEEYTKATGRNIPYNLHRLMHSNLDNAARIDNYAARLFTTANELSTTYNAVLRQQIHAVQNDAPINPNQQTNPIKSETRYTSPAPSGTTIISDIDDIEAQDVYASFRRRSC